MRSAPVILVAGPALAVGSFALGLAGWLPQWLVGASALGGGALLVCAIVVGVSRPQSRLFGPVVTHAATGRAEVALTFDDGPDPDSTPRLLEALERAEARATFFVLADRVGRYPDLARAIAARHEIGLHGASHHPWLTLRAPEVGASELRDAAAAIAAITGVTPTTFRPPFGVTSPRLAEAARRAALEVVWCSLRTGDGAKMAPATLRARCRRAVAGDIVLLHEGPRAARDAIGDVLADLAARGLRAVTVRELLA